LLGCWVMERSCWRRAAKTEARKKGRWDGMVGGVVCMFWWICGFVRPSLPRWSLGVLLKVSSMVFLCWWGDVCVPILGRR
jgi:hypothetical protein